MRFRHFGILLLLAVGVLPLLCAGWLMIRRARETALAEVKVGNGRLAERAASRIRAVVEEQVRLLSTLAGPFAPAVKIEPEQGERVVKNYRIFYSYLRSLDVVGRDCHELATSRLDGKTRERCGEPAVDTALSGQVYRSDIALSSDFSPVMTLGVPLEIAGERIGAAVADVDMIGIWDVVNEIRVGDTGYARLVTSDGTLIAHGEPEERRRVFLREKDPFAPHVRQAGRDGVRYSNSQHKEVLAMSAAVPDLGWTVVVEQPIAEAYRAATWMTRDLLVVVGAATFLAIFLGLALGGRPVRVIERLRRHARDVAQGNLDARIEEKPLVEEMRALVDSMNEMTGDIKRMQDDIRARERLSTFARVAAGLAHDLRTPIQAVRSACDAVLQSSGEPGAVDYLRQVSQTHLKRLDRYVVDLQRLAHDGQIPLELRRVDPRALIDQVVADAAANLKWSGVAFVAQGQAAPIFLDESLVARAVTNLVSNAGDACLMRRGAEMRVTVEVSDVDDGKTLVISVTDNGVGIAKDRLEELMVHDFRSSKRSSGVGLGLGVTRHVASAHGGRVTVESREGEGSTFRIHLPRTEVADEAFSEPTTRRPADERADGPGRRPAHSGA